ncbi:MAG: S41 family peptidase [Bacteroidota bacterium]
MSFKLKLFFVLLSTIVLTASIIIKTREQQLEEQLELFKEFYGLMDKNYVDTINLPDLMKKTIKKTVAELDRWSSYHDVEEAKKRTDDWKGIQYAGIGSGVKQTDSGIVITYPYDNMPAMKSGLKTGDLIIEINGRNVQKQLLDTVVKQLKGKDGDSLFLTIKRPYMGILKVALARKTVVDLAVPNYFMENDSTGYIKIYHFLYESSNSVRSKVIELKEKGMKRLVLDLRGNYGGLVKEATSTLSIFLPLNSLVCSVRGKDSSKNYSYNTLDKPVDTLMPITVLTDRRTISSGEIFTGCLKDYKRATIIGDTTYGKGFVQSTYYFKNGAILYITAGRYYTPSRNFIGGKGVAPNIYEKTTDSIPLEFQAILSSGIISNYCILKRNLYKNESAIIDDKTYNDFVSFYRNNMGFIKLSEESVLSQFQQYSSFKSIKKEIETRKQNLTTIYRKEMELELQKEILKQQYQYNSVDKIEFEHSSMYDLLVQRGYIRKN